MNDINSDKMLEIIREWTIKLYSQVLDNGFENSCNASYIKLGNTSNPQLRKLLTCSRTKDEYIYQIYNQIREIIWDLVDPYIT